MTGLDAASARAHRDLRPGVPGADETAGSLTVLTFASVGAELEHVAEVLRRAHLEDGLAWADMAVLVRSGARSIPTVRRVLGSAGVPIQVAGDEIPLRLEPAVGVLLAALRVAADPAALTAEAARSLVVSPLAAADTADLRRLGRALRAQARAAGGEHAGAGSGELLRLAVADPARLAGSEARLARPVRRLGELLASAGALLDGGGSVEEALWALWHGSGWPRRLAEVAAGSGSSARRADRDLDAVCALFDLAARAAGATPTRPTQESSGHARVRTFLAEIEAQEIPGDAASTRAVDARRGAGAHRAPVQGPGVAAGGGRGRPGRPLARPAPPRFAARRRPDRPGRPGRAALDRRGARRGAAPVLRRGDPREAQPARHGGLHPGRGRRAPVPLPARAGGRARRRPGAARPAALDGRPGRGAALGAGRPGVLGRAAAGGGRPAGGPGDLAGRRRPSARPGRVAGPLVGDDGGDGSGPPGARPRRAGRPVGQRRRRARLPARCAGSCSGRPGPRRSRRPPSGSARSCTR